MSMTFNFIYIYTQYERSKRGEGNFLDLLKADKEVSAVMKPEELEVLFDLGYHTKHVDTIFNRVFG